MKNKNPVESKHVLKAMKMIDDEGIPARMQARSYILTRKGKLYPPKWTLALAKAIADKSKDPEKKARKLLKDMNGGVAVNTVLENLGFNIEAA